LRLDLAGGAFADATVVYGDQGVSAGMEAGVERARPERRPVGGGSSYQVLIEVKADAVRSRLFTPRECARLMGLPDSYILPANARAAVDLLGDGLCVEVVRFLSPQSLRAAVSGANPRDESKARRLSFLAPEKRDWPQDEVFAEANSSPRAREYRCCTSTDSVCPGSSPRVRGTRPAGAEAHHLDRFIPACAGNTPRSGGRAPISPVHRRVRGEHLSMPL
jgi:hypothetical protein